MISEGIQGSLPIFRCLHQKALHLQKRLCNLLV